MYQHYNENCESVGLCRKPREMGVGCPSKLGRVLGVVSLPVKKNCFSENNAISCMCYNINYFHSQHT